MSSMWCFHTCPTTKIFLAVMFLWKMYPLPPHCFSSKQSFWVPCNTRSLCWIEWVSACSVLHVSVVWIYTIEIFFFLCLGTWSMKEIELQPPLSPFVAITYFSYSLHWIWMCDCFFEREEWCRVSTPSNGWALPSKFWRRTLLSVPTLNPLL